MKVLLTGGAGYIGSHVILSLLDKGHEVVVIDDLSTGYKKLIPQNVKLYKCNVNNTDKIEKIIKSIKFDLIMHFAGFIKVEESVSNPAKYYENNTDNAIKLFETCCKNNLNNIIFSSTAATYGNPKNSFSITEDQILNPINPYGKSKMKTENYLLKNKHRLNSIILRYFNVAGSDKKMRSGLISNEATHLIKIISEVAVGKRKKISIFGKDYNTHDGTAIRDFIHISDLADIHIRAAKYLLENEETNIFNCGYGKGYSVLDIIKTANKITNNKIKYDFSQRRNGDPEQLVANVDKIKKHINWQPSNNDLNTIIQSAIDWEKNYAKDS
tara:strand:- start:3241 stop:4221 length:981 start_codon:yes stop_codon:yes gene_type:complete